jgi:cytochrome oxidase assembly protein ShyY1
VTPWARYSFFSTTVLAAVVASSLGVWQLRRLAERRARNRSALAERDRPPVDLSQETLPESVFYRSVRATGVFDFDHQVVL